jgi:hypothetical protein
MQASQEFHLAQAYKSQSLIRHVVYRPDQSKDLPWASYYRGNRSVSFTTLEEAQTFHSQQGDPLVITK